MNATAAIAAIHLSGPIQNAPWMNRLIYAPWIFVNA
jgi:hypothetical protein